ncbi:hypothetical protein BOTCAL_0030g00450 [Botryotinia calthae]|uniref:Uncharacterized protein n=1 Tax=Botryotinia calthae TaxID=38488 RepID=A0A4Y8DDW1_9HELO|nr:hypothetical protein BOTCAL_0030g00450 [Botryotinia calthae]
MGGSFTIPAPEMKEVISRLIQNKVGESETGTDSTLKGKFKDLLAEANQVCHDEVQRRIR